MDDVSKAKYLIANVDYMTIATANSNGKPWVSPVGFIADKRNNLFWVSNQDSVHSKNISNRPEVAIVIVGKLPDGSTDGLYFDATASEITAEDEIEYAIKVLVRRPKDPKFDINSISQVRGTAVWRVYKAIPLSISKRSDETKNDQAITVRKPIELL